MRVILLILGAIVLAFFAYQCIRFFLMVQVSKKLVATSVPYERFGTDAGTAILVLGDSTAVGVGADSPEESVAGRVSEYLKASSTENYARSGAVTADLPGQITRAVRDSYQLILVQIGGNDIIRFRSAEKAGAELRAALGMLPAAGKVVIVSAGDVGGATLFPFPVRAFHAKLNAEYHRTFAKIAAEAGMTYVDFGASPATRLISERPDIYLAADGLHPSSAGYALWFEDIRPHL